MTYASVLLPTEAYEQANMPRFRINRGNIVS